MLIDVLPLVSSRGTIVDGATKLPDLSGGGAREATDGKEREMQK